jgi:hypothetical protein
MNNLGHLSYTASHWLNFAEYLFVGRFVEFQCPVLSVCVCVYSHAFVYMWAYVCAYVCMCVEEERTATCPYFVCTLLCRGQKWEHLYIIGM